MATTRINSEIHVVPAINAIVAKLTVSLSEQGAWQTAGSEEARPDVSSDHGSDL
jgi:hypothetical protein